MEGITIDWWPIAAVGFLVALDVITGLLKGWTTHTLSSKAMRNLVEKGCITAEVYERITGMAYEEVTV